MEDALFLVRLPAKPRQRQTSDKLLLDLQELGQPTSSRNQGRGYDPDWRVNKARQRIQGAVAVTDGGLGKWAMIWGELP